MAYALKTSCAKNIIGVIPYFPYSKQCKMRKRGSIVCKLLASMLARAGKSIKAKLMKLFGKSFFNESLVRFVLYRTNTHHHHGPASEGDPRLLQFSSG